MLNDDVKDFMAINIFDSTAAKISDIKVDSMSSFLNLRTHRINHTIMYTLYHHEMSYALLHWEYGMDLTTEYWCGEVKACKT